MEKKYINKDNYHSIINNMNNSELGKREKYASSKFMRLVVIILYFSFVAISYLFYKKYKTQKRGLLILIYILFTYLFYKNYVKIAFYSSKFIENNLLFKI
tara:strand:+ start:395 stop:694 length:300 start_codon:yes stop_codon:yes gene_type:complete